MAHQCSHTMAELRSSVGQNPPGAIPLSPPLKELITLKAQCMYIYIMVVRQFSPWWKGHPERWGAETELGAFWMGSTPQLSIITAPTKRSLSAGSHGGTDTINNLKNINNLGFFFLFLIASPPPPLRLPFSSTSFPSSPPGTSTGGVPLSINLISQLSECRIVNSRACVCDWGGGG